MPQNNSLSGDARIINGPSLKKTVLLISFIAGGSLLTGYARSNPDVMEHGKALCAHFVDRFTHPTEEPLTPCL